MPRALAVSLLLLLAGCSTAPEAGDADLRRVHEALFDVYFPVDALPLNDALKRGAAAVRDEAWDQFSRSPALLGLLRAVGDPAFLALPTERREARLRALHQSSDNERRRLAQQLRITYLAAIYGSPLGPALAGVRVPPVEHPDLDAYVRANTPAFPFGRVVYDPKRDLLRPAEGRFDYIVVGSGPAGSALAWQLRAKGKSVLLLEAGPFILPGALDTRVVPDLLVDGGRRTSVDGGVFFRSGRAVGGGSTVNVDLAFAPTLPLIARRIEEWRAEGRIGKGDFAPADVARAYAWVTKKLGTRPVPETEINENNRILWDGAKALGLQPKRYDLNTHAPGAAPSPVSDKRSAVDALLLEAMLDRRNPLALVPDVRVQRVLIGDRGATGVEFTSVPGRLLPGALHDPLRLAMPTYKTVRAEAGRVVLCAGALGSPALLLRSGLTNPRIGAGIVAHPSLPVIGRFDRPINVLEGTPASVYVDDPERGILLESMSEEPKYGAMMIPGGAAEVFEAVSAFPRLGGFGVLLIDTPRDENRVRLSETGDVEIVYTLGDADKRRFASGVAAAVRILFQAGAKQVWVPTQQEFTTSTGAPLGRSFLADASEADLVERQLSLLPNQAMISSAHVQGTNKIGSSAATGVVSPGFEVWGTPNLYIVDSSVFPTSIGANPMQSLYTLGVLAAERLEP